MLAFGRTHGNRVQVFRLGGIYGPGRSVIEDIRDGSAQENTDSVDEAFTAIRFEFHSPRSVAKHNLLTRFAQGDFQSQPRSNIRNPDTTGVAAFLRYGRAWSRRRLGCASGRASWVLTSLSGWRSQKSTGRSEQPKHPSKPSRRETHGAANVTRRPTVRDRCLAQVRQHLLRERGT